MSVREEGYIGKCAGKEKAARRCGEVRYMRNCHLSQFSKFHIKEF
jgi:hypothetical protein